MMMMFLCVKQPVPDPSTNLVFKADLLRGVVVVVL